jgi:multisubunit Na+/H+ antiporter MnhG subunit
MLARISLSKENNMSQNSTEPGHGSSVAAWTSVIIIIVAFGIGTLFFWLDNAAMVWASAGLAVLGPVVGWVLRRAGYGVGGEHTKAH